MSVVIEVVLVVIGVAAIDEESEVVDEVRGWGVIGGATDEAVTHVAE